MAEQETTEPDEAEVAEASAEGGEGSSEENAGSKKKKKKLAFLGGGVIGILCLAYMASLMAVPKVVEDPDLDGPFVAALLTDKVSANLDGSNRKRFIQLDLNLVYRAYEGTYFDKRVADPLFEPKMRHALLGVLTTVTMEDVTGALSHAVWLQELRDALEPIVFPVFVGKTDKPTDRDLESGLRPGGFLRSSNFRGRFFEHSLHVNAPERTLQLDDGPVVEFAEGATEVEVLSPLGESVFLDVSDIKKEFVGDVRIGVRGSIDEVLLKDIIIQ